MIINYIRMLDTCIIPCSFRHMHQFKSAVSGRIAYIMLCNKKGVSRVTCSFAWINKKIILLCRAIHKENITCMAAHRNASRTRSLAYCSSQFIALQTQIFALFFLKFLNYDRNKYTLNRSSLFPYGGKFSHDKVNTI